MTFGIDVSHYQGVIDWRRAAADGVEFAFAKASESTGTTDALLARNLAGMRAAGVVPGAYHFLRPGDGAAQAEHFARVVGDPSDLLVALDVEASGIAWSTVKGWRDRWDALHPGHPVIVYTGRDLWGRVTGDPAGGGASLGPLWAAGRVPNAYGDSAGNGLARSWAAWRTSVSHPPFAGWTKPLIVQWTENVRVAGVPTPCDGDHTDLTAAELRTLTTTGDTMPTADEIAAAVWAYALNSRWTGQPSPASRMLESTQYYAIQGGANTLVPTTASTGPGTPTTAKALADAVAELPAGRLDPVALAAALAGPLAAELAAKLPAAGITAADVQGAAEAAVRSVLGSLG